MEPKEQPTELGYYWARRAEVLPREIVKLTDDTRGFQFVEVHGDEHIFDVSEFFDYVGPIIDPLAEKAT